MASTLPTPAEGHGTTGAQLARISSGIAVVYKQLFGRGPTGVRAHFVGPDAVLCLLEDSMTPAERRMAALGEHQRLRDVRLFFQYATEEDMRAVVEEATGRRVRAFVSGHDTHIDVAAELFVLEG